MSTGKPDSRKTHVIRIFGTNRDGELLQSMWADVERMDVIKSGMGNADIPGAQWQGHQQQLKWCDDPNSDDFEENGNPSRLEELVKVCDPTVPNQNFEDPEEWIPIKRIERMRSVSSHENYEGQQEQVKSVEENESRKFEPRRITHCDTNIDDDAANAADSGQKVYVVSSDDYEKTSGKTDKKQYVEHEIVTSLKQGGNVVGQYQPGDQGRQVFFKNDYIIDSTEAAKMAEVGPHGFDPPYRLDPYQNIINVKFKSIYVVVEVGLGNNGSSYGPYGDAPGAGSPSIASDVVDNGVKLLDTVAVPEGNSSGGGFTGCFEYPEGFTAETAWELWLIGGPDHESIPATVLPAVHNTCPMIPPEGFVLSPVNFENHATASRQYLYRVSAGEKLISVTAGGLNSTFTSNDPPLRSVTSTGSGTLTVRVFSTVRKKVEKLSDLIDIFSDGDPRPDEDSSCSLAVTSDNEGGFTVNVELEDGATQTDNWGKKYQPYKVTLDHGDFVIRHPSQPPPRLPK